MKAEGEVESPQGILSCQLFGSISTLFNLSMDHLKHNFLFAFCVCLGH